MQRMNQARVATYFLAVSILSGCGAVFPEVATPLRDVPAEKEIKPSPPTDLMFLRVAGAHIPAMTRDGRTWKDEEGSKPDPFAVVYVGGKEVFRTRVESNTVDPTWSVQPSGNYRVPKGSIVQIDLMNNKSMGDEVICSEHVTDVDEEISTGEIQLDLRCDGGALMTFVIGPAHPMIGLGFSYEVVLGGVNVTRLYAHSPASRGGMKKGDKILQVMGKKVEKMENGEAQSLINSNAQRGVQLLLQHDNGQTQNVTLKEGAVYPLRSELGRQAGDRE